MKRKVKIGIAGAVLFVVGMAYRSHVNARVVPTVIGGTVNAVGDIADTTTGVVTGFFGGRRRHERRDDRNDNNNNGRRNRRGRRVR